MASDLRSGIRSEISSEPATETSPEAVTLEAEGAASPSEGSAESADLTASSEPSSSTAPGSTAAEESDAAAKRADLNLVTGPETSAAEGNVDSVTSSDAADSAEGDRQQGQGIPVWLGLLGLVIAALIVGYQMRLNGQLEAEVTGLEAELGRTQAVLSAHQSHLGDIRGGVRALADQLQSLQSLVETEPVVARDEGAIR